MEREIDYFRRRASEERVAAMKAAHAKVREAHLDMARRYDERAIAAAQTEVVDLSTVA